MAFYRGRAHGLRIVQRLCNDRDFPLEPVQILHPLQYGHDGVRAVDLGLDGVGSGVGAAFLVIVVVEKVNV